MKRIALLLPFAALVMPSVSVQAMPRDPSVDRVSESQLVQPARKRERAKLAPATPCTGCATQPSSHPPMLETPIPGLLLIPAEAAAI